MKSNGGGGGGEVDLVDYRGRVGGGELVVHV